MTNTNCIHHPYFTCAALEFDLALGLVKNALGATQRLSPINLRLLAYLVNHHGEVISRAQLFDAIWPNQIVSDEVLTRAVSDIRIQLAKLDDSSKFIETLPKRGYRWPIELIPSAAQSPNLRDAPAANPVDFAEPSVPSTRPVDRRLIHGVGYIFAALFLAWAVIWWLSLSAVNQISLAVLPTLSDRPQTEQLAVVVNESMLQVLRKDSRLKLLSASAIASRPQNPFPYFFKEFGAKWLLESRVKDGEGFYEFELSLVDARSGIELRSAHIEFANNTDLLTKLAKKLEIDFFAEDVGY